MLGVNYHVMNTAIHVHAPHDTNAVFFRGPPAALCRSHCHCHGWQMLCQGPGHLANRLLLLQRGHCYGFSPCTLASPMTPSCCVGLDTILVRAQHDAHAARVQVCASGAGSNLRTRHAFKFARAARWRGPRRIAGACAAVRGADLPGTSEPAAARHASRESGPWPEKIRALPRRRQPNLKRTAARAASRVATDSEESCGGCAAPRPQAAHTQRRPRLAVTRITPGRDLEPRILRLGPGPGSPGLRHTAAECRRINTVKTLHNAA